MTKMITVRFKIEEIRNHALHSATWGDPMEWILEKCDAIGIEDVTASFHDKCLENNGYEYTLVLTFDRDEDFKVFRKHYNKLIKRIKPIPEKGRKYDYNNISAHFGKNK